MDSPRPDLQTLIPAPYRRQDYADGAAYSQGRFVPIAEARISVLDWGFTRSDVVYDVVHVHDGKFFRLQAHLERFARSMAQRRLDVGMTLAQVRENLHQVVALSGLRAAYVAMVASRGRPRIGGSRRPEDCDNHLISYAIPWIDVVPKSVQARGTRLWVAGTPRVPDASVDPTVKNYQWSDLTSGLLEAHDHDHDTSITCDAQGYVTEGPGFNVFAVCEGRVLTSAHGALHGITRRTVLELCQKLGIPAEARPLPLEEFQRADEIFLATTAGGVMFVRELNGRVLPRGDDSPIAHRLHEAYWAAHQDPAWVEAVAYD